MRRPKRAACWLLVAALGLPHAPVAAQVAAQDVALPSLGEPASEDFGVTAERRLGEQVMREIRRDPAYLDDPLLLTHVQSLWRPLLEAARARGDIEPDAEANFAWEAFLVRDRAVNAFALPGGYVGIHLGLIAVTASADELASVLAHELTHVSQRHIARGFANSKRHSLVSVAAMLLAVLAAGRANNADAMQAAVVGGQAAVAQGQLNFSRDVEREADRIGFAVLVAAGFAAGGMADMFTRLEAANRLNDTGAFPYLRSHPLTGDRLAEARARLLAAPPGVNAAARPTWRHALMQARAKVLMEPTAGAWRRLLDAFNGRDGAVMPAAPKPRAIALYAAALGAAKLGEHAVAVSALRQLEGLLAEPAHADADAAALVSLLRAELALARGEATASLAMLARPLAVAGDERPWLLLHAASAREALRTGGTGGPTSAEVRRAMEALQTWVSAHPADALAWARLGDTAEALGFTQRSMRARAEAAFAGGDLNGAIDRMRAAQQAGRGPGADFIEAQAVEARLRDLIATRRALLIEARGERAGGDPPR
jgi:predicted Zn-dependent protease